MDSVYYCCKYLELWHRAPTFLLLNDATYNLIINQRAYQLRELSAKEAI